MYTGIFFWPNHPYLNLEKIFIASVVERIRKYRVEWKLCLLLVCLFNNHSIHQQIIYSTIHQYIYIIINYNMQFFTKRESSYYDNTAFFIENHGDDNLDNLVHNYNGSSGEWSLMMVKKCTIKYFMIVKKCTIKYFMVVKKCDIKYFMIVKKCIYAFFNPSKNWQFQNIKFPNSSL